MPGYQREALAWLGDTRSLYGSAGVPGSGEDKIKRLRRSTPEANVPDPIFAQRNGLA